jgi:hypothetical protein
MIGWKLYTTIYRLYIGKVYGGKRRDSHYSVYLDIMFFPGTGVSSLNRNIYLPTVFQDFIICESIVGVFLFLCCRVRRP